MLSPRAYIAMEFITTALVKVCLIRQIDDLITLIDENTATISTPDDQLWADCMSAIRKYLVAKKERAE